MQRVACIIYITQVLVLCLIYTYTFALERRTPLGIKCIYHIAGMFGRRKVWQIIMNEHNFAKLKVICMCNTIILHNRPIRQAFLPILNTYQSILPNIPAIQYQAKHSCLCCNLCIMPGILQNIRMHFIDPRNFCHLMDLGVVGKFWLLLSGTLF